MLCLISLCRVICARLCLDQIKGHNLSGQNCCGNWWNSGFVFNGSNFKKLADFNAALRLWDTILDFAISNGSFNGLYFLRMHIVLWSCFIAYHLLMRQRHRYWLCGTESVYDTFITDHRVKRCLYQDNGIGFKKMCLDRCKKIILFTFFESSHFISESSGWLNSLYWLFVR